MPWASPRQPGGWTPVIRRFRDGHRETWWAADVTLAHEGPDQPSRLVVATTDPAALPAASTWYLTTNLPRPGSPRAAESPLAPADLAEVVRLYGLRMWVEQSDKQVKQELGWADWQVRPDRAIRRHWHLVCCACSFCWWAWSRAPTGPSPLADVGSCQPDPADPSPPAAAGRGKMWAGEALRADRPNVPWAVVLRRVQAWLHPWTMLWRWWRAWPTVPHRCPYKPCLIGSDSATRWTATSDDNKVP